MRDYSIATLTYNEMWVSSLAAVIAAIATIILAFFTYRLAEATTKVIPKTSRLGLECGESEPFVRQYLGRRAFRLRVKNLGEATATNCEVKAEFLEWNPFEKLAGEDVSIDASVLHWVRRAINVHWYARQDLRESYFKSVPGAVSRIHIRPGESELVDVIFAPMEPSDTVDALEDHQLVHKKRAQLYSHRWLFLRTGTDRVPPGDYRVRITAYADNGPPVQKTLRISYRGGDDLRLEE